MRLTALRRFMKAILRARFSILALAVLTIAPSCSAQATLAGDWQGTYVDANGITFRLVWHVTAAPDGKLTSTLDNVDQSIFGMKVKTTTVKDSDVKMEVDDVISPNGQPIHLKASFDGTLNKEEDKVVGTWTQSAPPQDSLQITFRHGPPEPPTITAAAGSSAPSH
jgi:hypothetical protein